jgi:hypothetical protein
VDLELTVAARIGALRTLTKIVAQTTLGTPSVALGDTRGLVPHQLRNDSREIKRPHNAPNAHSVDTIRDRARPYGSVRMTASTVSFDPYGGCVYVQ